MSKRIEQKFIRKTTIKIIKLIKMKEIKNKNLPATIVERRDISQTNALPLINTMERKYPCFTMRITKNKSLLQNLPVMNP